MSLLLTIVGVPYLVPTGVAVYRRHRDVKPLFLINLLLGWTIIGWIATLVWSLTGEVERDEIAARGDRLRAGGGLHLQGGDPRHDATPARKLPGA